jgi:tRNA splicing endonuclease
VGIGSSNIFLKNQVMNLQDTGVRGQQVSFTNDSLIGYKKYKFATAYFEAPFELRYFSNKENRNSGFKAAIGLRIGTLLSAHTKGVYSVDGNKTTDKVDTKRYLEKWRFAATMRVGYGNFTLLGSFNLNSLFKATNGPQVAPYSIGICISGL